MISLPLPFLCWDPVPIRNMGSYPCIGKYILLIPRSPGIHNQCTQSRSFLSDPSYAYCILLIFSRRNLHDKCSPSPFFTSNLDRSPHKLQNTQNQSQAQAIPFCGMGRISLIKFVEDMLLDFFRHSAACILLSKISYKKGHFPKITFRKMSLLHKLHLL